MLFPHRFMLAAPAALSLALAGWAAAAQQGSQPDSAAAAHLPNQQSQQTGQQGAPAQVTGARQMSRRDANGAARPSGFNPRFSPEGERFAQQGGEQLYRAICQGCHMSQGQGAQGAGVYPALARNARLAAGPYPAQVVLHGLHGMPPFAERLSDQQVADVVNYVRTHFDNGYQDALTPQDVQKLRP